MQPTFSVDVPTTTFTKLEFLDNSDPGKDTVVRMKAREWVNKNRKLGGQGTSKARLRNAVLKTDEENQERRLVRRKSATPTIITTIPNAVGASSVEPFGILPNIGRDFDHIIKYCVLLQK
jgi:hypothetical protein